MSDRKEKFSQLFSLNGKQSFINNPAAIIPQMKELQFDRYDIGIMKMIIETCPNEISRIMSSIDSMEQNDAAAKISDETGLKKDALFSIINDIAQVIVPENSVQLDTDNSVLDDVKESFIKIGAGSIWMHGVSIAGMICESNGKRSFIPEVSISNERLKIYDCFSSDMSYDDGTRYTGGIRVTDIIQMNDPQVVGQYGTDNVSGYVFVSHGKGKLALTENEFYEGDFVDNRRTGRGKYVWANGDVYEGDFSNDRRTGKGRFVWANGDVYEGDFIEDDFCGRGRETWGDGSSYEGDFADSKRTGKGKYVWANGDIYTGGFINNERTGKGRFVWANGDVYEGDFVDNKFNGEGLMTYANGSWYNGSWKQNERDGHGTEHELNSWFKKKMVYYNKGKKQ